MIEEAIQVLAQRGRDHRRSRGNPEHHRRDSRQQLPGVWDVCRARQPQGPRRGVLDDVQVRHEARFQCLSGIGERPFQDADPVAAVQPGESAEQHAIRYEQENLDISDEMDVNADRARWQTDRKRTCSLGDARHRRSDHGAPVSTRCCSPAEQQRGDRGESRAPDHDRAVRDAPEQPGEPTRRLQSETRPVRGHLQRDCVLGAAADRDRVRLRAGDQAPGAAAIGAVTQRCGR